MMGVLGRNLDQGWIYSCPSFRVGVGESEVLLLRGATLILACQTNSLLFFCGSF